MTPDKPGRELLATPYVLRRDIASARQFPQEFDEPVVWILRVAPRGLQARSVERNDDVGDFQPDFVEAGGQPFATRVLPP